MLATLLRTLFVCLLLLSPVASGQSAVQLISTDKITRLSSYIKVFRENQNQLTVDQARTRIEEFYFPSDENPNYGFHPTGVWLYTTIGNVTDTENWVLDLGSTQLDKVDMYLLVDGKIIAQTQQGKTRLNQLYRFPTIKVTFPYAQTVEVFVRLENLKSSLVAPLDIQSQNNYERINFYDNMVWGFRTWYRLPEDKKATALDPTGDDNPDIEKYMGYGELGGLWSISDKHSLEFMLRNNLRSDNKGAIQLGWSFPINDKIQGYVEYFNGYGESLIYYNQHTQMLGIGFKMTNWL